MNNKVSLIFPAYNEEERIASSLNTTIEYLNNHYSNYEIIVVNDGSTDNTSEVLKSFGNSIIVLDFKNNLGKGFGVREGMLKATGDICIFTDSDLSTPIYELEKVVAKINEGYDICIGSRAIDRSYVKVHQPFYRESMGRVFNFFVQSLVFKGIMDTQCGFKAFNSISAKSIFSKTKINGFSFDVEVLYLAKKMGFRVTEVPVEWYNDNRSKVNPITDSLMMFIELLKIKKLHKKG